MPQKRYQELQEIEPIVTIWITADSFGHHIIENKQFIREISTPKFFVPLAQYFTQQTFRTKLVAIWWLMTHRNNPSPHICIPGLTGFTLRAIDGLVWLLGYRVITVITKNSGMEHRPYKLSSANWYNEVIRVLQFLPEPAVLTVGEGASGRTEVSQFADKKQTWALNPDWRSGTLALPWPQM